MVKCATLILQTKPAELIPSKSKANEVTLGEIEPADQSGSSRDAMANQVAELQKSSRDQNAVLKALISKIKNRSSRSKSPRPPSRASSAASLGSLDSTNLDDVDDDDADSVESQTVPHFAEQVVAGKK